MTKPPQSKTSQKDYVQSAVRFPPALRAEIQADAERNGRSFNAEVLARIQSNKIEAVLAELDDVKAMLRKVLDAVT